MHPSLVEFVDVLVVPEYHLDQPAFLVRLVHQFARTVVIRFEEDCPELRPAEFIILRIIPVLVLLQVCVLLIGRFG